MSFILDALKKSESDRQRQNGPALFEVRVAPRRAALPPWAIAIAALLAVNLAIVVWMMTRHAAPPPASPPTGAAPPAAAAPVVAAAPAPGATAPSGAPAGPGGTAPPPAPPPAPPAATTPAPQATLASAPAPEAAPAAAPAAGTSPDDYAPAAEPAADGGFGGEVRRGTGEGVPLYRQSTAAAQLPQLHLDLHAYAVKPEDRWAMINMHKVREGDSLPEGVHVEQITPDGVVLSYQGSQFLLPRD
jgi:general secretion pathway protein B